MVTHSIWTKSPSTSRNSPSSLDTPATHGPSSSPPSPTDTTTFSSTCLPSTQRCGGRSKNAEKQSFLIGYCSAPAPHLSLRQKHSIGSTPISTGPLQYSNNIYMTTPLRYSTDSDETTRSNPVYSTNTKQNPPQKLTHELCQLFQSR